MIANASGDSSSGAFETTARTSRVRSSAVGPRPPVAITTSARMHAIRKASIPASSVSATVVWNVTGIPRTPSSAEIQRLFVSSRWPVVNSSPMAITSARILRPFSLRCLAMKTEARCRGFAENRPEG